MTETRVTTLADFLLARIAEEEAAAQAATPGPWQPEGIHEGEPANETWEVTGPRGEDGWTADVVAVDFDRDYHMPMGGCPRREDAAHIARHDPAFVLAECDAKRRVVELHAVVPVATGPNSGHMVCLGCGDLAPCPTVRFLALPYVQHPDYQKGWLP